MYSEAPVSVFSEGFGALSSIIPKMMPASSVGQFLATLFLIGLPLLFVVKLLSHGNPYK